MSILRQSIDIMVGVQRQVELGYWLIQFLIVVNDKLIYICIVLYCIVLYCIVLYCIVFIKVTPSAQGWCEWGTQQDTVG